jgi:hypothetical protein
LQPAASVIVSRGTETVSAPTFGGELIYLACKEAVSFLVCIDVFDRWLVDRMTLNT